MPPPKRTRPFISSIYLLAASLTALMMLRSFHTCDHLALFRARAATSLQSGNGFLIAGYVSDAGPHHPLGFVRTSMPLGPLSLAMFEDQTLFMSHLNYASNGFDCELLGFQIVVSSTDERNTTLVQVPHWAPIAAFTLLACRDLIRRTSRSRCPRTSHGFAPINTAATS